MKIIKFMGIGLTTIILVAVILHFTLSSAYTVTRSTTINAPKELVWPYVISLKKRVMWSPWAKMDPNMEVKYKGIDGEVGSITMWTGNEDVGSGSQEITVMTDDSVRSHLVFIEPFEDQSDAWVKVTEQDGITTVLWGLEGEMPFPFNFMFDMDAMIGADYEKGLSSLKEICELESKDESILETFIEGDSTNTE